MVIVGSNLPERLRGALRLWLLEVEANVFIGDLPTTSIRTLWDAVLSNAGDGSVQLIHQVNGEWSYCKYNCDDRGLEFIHGVPVAMLRVQIP